MSLHAGFPSPPRTPLRNLDIDRNGMYNSPTTPSPSVYATAKTSRSVTMSRSLRRRSSQQTIRARLEDWESSRGSARSSLDNNGSGLSSDPPDSMPVVVTERRREGEGGRWDDTPPRRAVGFLPSGDGDDDDDDDDEAMLTPTREPHTTPTTARSATPPPLLLHDGLFVTPPKATVHYPHVLEPITERASVATLRRSHSTLRQQSLSLPLVARLSPPTRSFSSALSSPSATSPSLSAARERVREGSPPPARVPTPLTHPTFKTTQTAKLGHLQASPPCPRDRFSPAERSLRMHTMKLPHDVAMHGPERRTEVLLRAARLKAAASIPDGHYHPWNMIARRRLQEQQTVSGEKERVGEGTAAGMGTRMRMRMNRRKGDAGRKAKVEKGMGGNAGTFPKKEKSGERVRVGAGKKRKGRRWDQFRRKMTWVCCAV